MINGILIESIGERKGKKYLVLTNAQNIKMVFLNFTIKFKDINYLYKNMDKLSLQRQHPIASEEIDPSRMT